jgi:hypothetical protein
LDRKDQRACRTFPVPLVLLARPVQRATGETLELQGHKAFRAWLVLMDRKGQQACQEPPVRKARRASKALQERPGPLGRKDRRAVRHLRRPRHQT